MTDNKHSCLEKIAARLEPGMLHSITLFCAECNKVFTPIAVDEENQTVSVSELFREQTKI